MVKRSLATRIGLTKDAKLLDEFGRLGEDADIQRSATKALRNLLQKDGAFRAAVATTFGQPVAQRSKDVAIEVTANTSVKMVPVAHSWARPKSPMSFISVQGQPMGITFALFKALRQVSNGLSEASLPAQVYALLDRVKAAMSGRMVRDDDAELKIVIEGIGIDIEVEGGHYSIQRRGSP